MPSPFPGMDPYLEAQPVWGDLHATMISVIKADLQKRLLAHYSVWSDVYIWLQQPDAETHNGKPNDLIASEVPHRPDGGLATLAAPATSILPAIRRQGNKYLKIKEVRSDRVITVMEFLSPANKTPGDDHEAFLAKRNEYLATGTNLVEIDLHRTGRRMPLGVPAPPTANYYILICRAADFPKTAIWPFSMRDSLPAIPIPLKPEDGFVTLPLHSCFDAAYDQGPYQKEVDYTRPPKMKLKDKDVAWARKLLHK